MHVRVDALNAPTELTGGEAPFWAFVLYSSDGTGVDAELEPVIFEPFRQATTHHRDGVGLGLYIVRRLMGEFRGAVAADSTPGKGSTFRVWISVRAPGGAGR